jgi:hypothetical protein
MTKEERLEKAKNHCFFIGLNDSGSELCKANSIYGIAGIHYIQEKLGIKTDATFITTPDMTITRNTARWKSGFGYGGKITWGDGNQELIILNTKPNACGMLVGGLEKLPDLTEIIKKLHILEKEDFKIDGIKVQWDFYQSNHFIDIFLVRQLLKNDIDLPPYIFIIHGSAPEFTHDNELGFGLYFDKSKTLKTHSKSLDTPFGTFYYLTDKYAESYYKKFQFIEEFAKMKRVIAAKKIFGNFIEISNETHQKLNNMNEILLGCNYFQKGDSKLVPLTLRGDLPAYLVRGLPSLNSEMIEMLGFENRAKKLGLYDRLSNANIFPHGAGYTLPDLLNVNKVIEIDNERYFDAEMQNDRGKKIISEVRELPFEYRGRTVVLRSIEINLIEIVTDTSICFKNLDKPIVQEGKKPILKPNFLQVLTIF